ncbi:hypothetical protein KFE98_00505 [bacterium SCSIO 12741]|nr:hypothetical protein KFE98_00505 [bacterium SCSIO 12741]
MEDIKGQFEIHEPFIITGRGLTFAGIVLQGEVNQGDVLQFDINGESLKRMITGVDMGMRLPKENRLTGLLIRCENEEEMKALRAWNPNKARASILSGRSS